MSVKIRGAVPVTALAAALDKVCAWRDTSFALVHHRRAAGKPGQRIYRSERRILYHRGLANFRFVANIIATACQREIKSDDSQSLPRRVTGRERSGGGGRETQSSEFVIQRRCDAR